MHAVKSVPVSVERLVWSLPRRRRRRKRIRKGKALSRANDMEERRTQYKVELRQQQPDNWTMARVWGWHCQQSQYLWSWQVILLDPWSSLFLPPFFLPSPDLKLAKRPSDPRHFIRNCRIHSSLFIIILHYENVLKKERERVRFDDQFERTKQNDTGIEWRRMRIRKRTNLYIFAIPLVGWLDGRYTGFTMKGK